MVAHRENLHYMDHEEADSNRDENVEPPASPEEVEEGLSAHAILPVDGQHGDVQNRCSA